MRTTPEYTVVLSGIDTLRANALGQLAPSRVELLDALQQKAVSERDARRGPRDELVVTTPWRLAGQPLLIAPHGGGKGQWKWLLRCPYARFDLGLGRLNGICCRVTLGSAFLWRFGYRQAWARVAKLIASWCDRSGVGFQTSELHLCADVAGLGVDALRVGDFVHRGTVARWTQEDAEILELTSDADGIGGHLERPTVDVHARHREQETLTFSPAAPHAAALYNKPREIRVKSRDKLWFADLWRARGWDGRSPITRVEMRYEREALHELGCEHVEPSFDQLDGLWAYSTRKWLRHTVPDPAVRRRSDWPDSPWWRVVQGASFGRPGAAPAQRERVRQFREEQILATVLGYVESWSAWRAGPAAVAPTLDLSTALREIADRADDHYLERGSDFLEQVRKKRRQIGFSR